MAINTVSFGNTPQAGDDLFALNQDALGVAFLDVMSNDLGGNSKTLYSLDDGISAGGKSPTDLLAQDTVRSEALSTDTSRNGARIWITSDGKVGYDAATLSSAFKQQLGALGAGQYLTDSFIYAIRMANGTLSWATATVQIMGVNDAPVVTGAVTGNGWEDGASVTLNALACASDVDNGTTLSIVNVPASLPAGVSCDAATHSFTVDPCNAVFQHLAAGQTTQVVVNYGVCDGIATTTASMKFTIIGTNDAPVVSAAVSGNAIEDGSAVTLNALANASDVDDGTTLAVVNVPASLPAGVTYDAATHSFKMDPSNEEYQDRSTGRTGNVMVNYGVSDGTSTTSASVKFTITGTNDAPMVTGTVSGNATEDGSTITLNALANSRDIDDGTTLSVVNVPASLPAGVTYDAATHSFKLDPSSAAYQHLAAGQAVDVTINYGVSDGIATTGASVNFTVTGTNDAPVVSGTVSGSATEDGSTVTLNALANASDIDDSTALSVVNVPGSLPAGVTYDAGTHTFGVHPSDAAYQNLAAGQALDVTINYGVSDGLATTAASVKFTVTGTNDAPVVSGTVSGSATEDGSTVTLNALANSSDIDNGTTLSVVNVPASLPAGVTYDAATHSFSLDPSDAAYQHVAAGDTVDVAVSYGVSDGTATTPASMKFIV